MRNFMNKYFSGPTFWYLLSGTSMVFAILNLLNGIPAQFDITITWIALATAEILTSIQKLKEPKTDV